MSTSTFTRPSVWIGCLACYNAGSLVGEWCDAEDAGYVTLDDLHGNPTHHEELWCFDHEGFPAGTGEMSPSTASQWDKLFDKVGETLWPALLTWTENGGHTVDVNGLPDLPSFENAYLGEYTSFADFLTEPIEAMQIGWPDEAIRYFDDEAYERDASYDYQVLDASGDGVYVFSEF